MKMRLIAVLTLFACAIVYAADPDGNAATETPKEVVNKYQFSDFRGPFGFISEETIVVQKGTRPLRLLQFGTSTTAGRSICIVVLALQADGTFKELYKTRPAVDALTPNFEGIDVLGMIQGQGPYLTLRWRTPGSGGVQSVDVLKYAEDSLIQVTTSIATGRAVRSWATRP